MMDRVYLLARLVNMRRRAGAGYVQSVRWAVRLVACDTDAARRQRSGS